MKKYLISFIILTITITSLCDTLISKNLTNEHLAYGIPGQADKIIYRSGYVLGHDNARKVPLWVSYHLTAEDLTGTQKRVDRFKPESLISRGKRAELSDYYKSGYDRGHMAPAGDMKRSRQIMLDSFYLSNMCPQTAGLNRGKWKSLESKVRDLVRNRREATIICGPMFKDLDGDGHGDYLERIGAGKVWVPTHYYKIIVYDEKDSINAIAFIMANKAIYENLDSYIVTVDDIERLTGLDFLDNLPDKLEDAIESRKHKNIDLWKTSSKTPIKTNPPVMVKKKNRDEILLIYHGNRKSKVFHAPGCRYYNCKSCTKIFKSRQDAIKSGYRPCKVCNP